MNLKSTLSFVDANPAGILTINGGSSSIKFALFQADHALRRILEGRMERIGLPGATFVVKSLNNAESFSRQVAAPDHAVAVGALGPGLIWYLAQAEGMDARQFNEMVNFQSGLLGVSETSSDMRDLLDREAQDVRASEAVALFCYQVKKWIGGFAAALHGLDTLVFAGGIGEKAPVVRARICRSEFLGIQLEEKRNAANAGVISTDASPVAVRVMHTDEEWMIAKTVCRVLGLIVKKEHDHENKKGV